LHASLKGEKSMRVRLLIIPLLVVFLSSCFLRLAYNNLDWILIWEIDKYFDLNDQQEDYLTKHLRRHLAWHRQREVQRYIGFLSAAKKKANDGLTMDDLNWFFASFQNLKASLGSRLAGDAAGFLATVSTEQERFLQTVLSSENEQLAEQLGLTAQQRLDRRAERTVEFAERWLGDLSEQQVDYIVKLSDQLPDNSSQWLDYRKNRQRQFIEIVQSANTRDVSNALREWFIEPPPVKLRAYRNQVKEMILDIDRNITSTQRAYFIGELDDLVNELHSILVDSRQKSVRLDKSISVGRLSL
jgi:hypothetical protein